jgi:hypothetical protein
MMPRNKQKEQADFDRLIADFRSGRMDDVIVDVFFPAHPHIVPSPGNSAYSPDWEPQIKAMAERAGLKYTPPANCN